MSQDNSTVADHVNSSVHVEKAQAPFTMIPNWLINERSVLSETLSAITYLASKSDSWVPIVADICKRFSWGDHTWRKVSKQMRQYKILTDKKYGTGTKLSFTLPWFDPRPRLVENPPVENQRSERDDPPVDFLRVIKSEGQENDVYTKERSLTKEQAVTKETTTDPVVVDELFENGNRLIPKRTLKKFLLAYPKAQINEKLSLFRHTSGVKIPGAWLRRALEENWTPKAEEAPKLMEEKEVEDPEIVQARYRRVQKEAVARLERAGIIDPRDGGCPDFNAVRDYDARLSTEIQIILNGYIA